MDLWVEWGIFCSQSKNLFIWQNLINIEMLTLKLTLKRIFLTERIVIFLWRASLSQQCVAETQNLGGLSFACCWWVFHCSQETWIHLAEPTSDSWKSNAHVQRFLLVIVIFSVPMLQRNCLALLGYYRKWQRNGRFIFCMCQTFSWKNVFVR